MQISDLKGCTAISYARWSSGAQASGDSLRRQTENAERFCLEAGMTLDRTIIDDGVSAFKGHNLEQGLGKLVGDIQAGRISSDMVLILENLDRYSRLDPVDALPRFLDLLRTGLAVVTLSDRRVHTEASYRGNMGALMQSLVHMSLANEESRKKSERLAHSWQGRAKKLEAGEKVALGPVPFWIDRETCGFNDREGHARLLFELAEAGHGLYAIAGELNSRGFPGPAGGAWSVGTVHRLLTSPTAYGSYTILGVERPNYFPAVISKAKWLAIRSRMSQRKSNPRAGNTANLFPRLLRCGHCGSSMQVNTTKSAGKPMAYATCTGKAYKRTNCTALNWNYSRFEAEFLHKIGFLAIPVPGEQSLDPKVNAIEEVIADLEIRRSNLLAGVETAGSPEVIRMLTAQADSISAQISAKLGEVMRMRENSARFQDAADSYVDFEKDQEEIRRLAREDRRAAQRLITDLVERVELESDSKDLRRAIVTLRGGYQHSIVFDATGEP